MARTDSTGPTHMNYGKYWTNPTTVGMRQRLASVGDYRHGPTVYGRSSDRPAGMSPGFVVGKPGVRDPHLNPERSWSAVRAAQRRWGALALPPVIDQLDESHRSSDGATLELSGPLAYGFVLTRPITVELFLENGEYVASADELNIFSLGASRQQALRNLRVRIVEQHRKLQERADRLGPAMKEIADRLSAIVVAEYA